MGLIESIVRHAHEVGEKGSVILERAKSCGIEPVVMKEVYEGRLKSEVLDMSEEEARDCVSGFRMRQTAQIGLWKRSLETVLEHITMKYIVLKGAPLGEILYGDVLWRDTRDIDLWVEKADIDEAVKSLEKAGYRVAQAPREWATNQVMLVHDILAPVELHWSLIMPPWSSPGFEAAYSRHQTITCLGMKLPYLSEEDLWIHLLLHSHEHFFAIKTFCDLVAGNKKLRHDERLLKSYNLMRLDGLVSREARAYEGEIELSHSMIVKDWYESVLCRDDRSHLIFGETSQVYAGLGVLLRASSMALMDGTCNRLVSGAKVIFYGPHRLGRKVHELLDRKSQGGPGR